MAPVTCEPVYCVQFPVRWENTGILARKDPHVSLEGPQITSQVSGLRPNSRCRDAGNSDRQAGNPHRSMRDHPVAAPRAFETPRNRDGDALPGLDGVSCHPSTLGRRGEEPNCILRCPLARKGQRRNRPEATYASSVWFSPE